MTATRESSTVAAALTGGAEAAGLWLLASPMALIRLCSHLIAGWGVEQGAEAARGQERTATRLEGRGSGLAASWISIR